MVGLLQLKLPTSTLVGFLINGLIMNILQHIFPQAENLVFQFQKSRGRIFCVFPRLLLLQSKSLRPLLAGEFVGRSSETQREMRKQRILSGTANGPIPPQNQPQKRKNRPEVRSAENQENGRGSEIRTRDLLVPNQSRYQTALRPEPRTLAYYTSGRPIFNRQAAGKRPSGDSCQSAAAWQAVMAATPQMSSAEQPRERSLTGLATPWRMGP